MPTSYTSLLGLALPVTGELSGTWGDTVNDYITQYLDAAVAGAQTISGSQTAVTLSKTTASSLTQAGSGATGSSQYQIINCTGNPAGLLTITAPAASKVYLLLNNTSTSQSVKIVGAGPTTGVTIAAARSALVAWNGSDFELVATDDASKLNGTLAIANGGTGQTTASAAFNALSPITTTGDLIIGNGSNSATRLAIGTNGYVLTSNGTTATWSSATAQVYPGAGIAVSTGSAWTTSLTAPSGTVVGTTDSQTLTNKTLTNPTITNYTETPLTANTGTSYTIDLANGTVQILTLTGNATITMPSVVAGKSFLVLLKTGAGSFTCTFTGVKWTGNTAPTFTATASRMDAVSFVSDGTNWYGTTAQNFYV